MRWVIKQTTDPFGSAKQRDLSEKDHGAKLCQDDSLDELVFSERPHSSFMLPLVYNTDWPTQLNIIILCVFLIVGFD